MGCRRTINDTDREQWVNNDEGLYAWMRASKMGLRQFVRAYRAEIDAHITARLAPAKRAWEA